MNELYKKSCQNCDYSKISLKANKLICIAYFKEVLVQKNHWCTMWKEKHGR